MTAEISRYTVEQMTRLVQFKRAERLARCLEPHESLLKSGARVSITEGFETREVDLFDAKVIRGAAFGLYDECVALGLGDAVRRKNITKK